jgi:TolB-like protein
MMSVVCVISCGAWADDEKKPVGKVAILPFLDQTGKPAGEVAQNCSDAWDVASDQFTARGFTVVDLSEVEKAAKELNLDLKDSETRNKETCAKLAEKLGADFVVSGTILEVRSGINRDVLFERNEGEARVQVKVFDRAQSKYVLENVGSGRRKGNIWIVYGSKSSRLRKSALLNATVNGLEPFVKRYPVQKENKNKSGKTR